MPEGAKEPETAQTFDEDEYKSNLIDNEDYSEETAAIKAKKKKEQLEAQAAKGPVAKIEIDLNVLAKAKSRKKVLVRRAGKSFYREQEVGSDEKDADKRHIKSTTESGTKEPAKTAAKSVTVDSIKDITNSVGLGESQGSGDRGVQVYHDMLKKTINVKMNYDGHDEQNKAIRTEDSTKIKTALDKSGVKYTTKTDVIVPGQLYFTIPMN